MVDRVRGGEEPTAAELLAAIPDALIVVGSDAVIKFANRRVQLMFGYDPTELLGQRLDVLIPPRFREQLKRELSGLFANDPSEATSLAGELFSLCRDGRELPIELHLSRLARPRELCACAAIRDISDRESFDKPARDDAAQLALAADSIDTALALFDAKRQLVWCNAAHRALIGPRIADSTGVSYEQTQMAWAEQLEFASDAERAQFYAEPGFDGHARRCMEWHLHDGRTLRVLERPIGHAGLVQTLWDLTEDFRREEDLRVACKVAEAASVTKSEFLSQTSHELRTPLNAILGFAQLMLRDKQRVLPDRQGERVKHILGAGEHLLHLIDELLDLARIEAGRLALSPEAVEVAMLVAEVVAALEELANKHQVRLVIAQGAPDAIVHCDRTRLRQILLNFGSNAIKYGRPGGSVCFRTACRDTVARMTVSDDGVGIDARHQDRIFQPFDRAGQETGSIEGTGIGLAISKRLAETMGGSIGFVSTCDRGSDFWLELPAHEASANESTRRASVRPGDSLRFTAHGRRYLIVCIEDNPSNVEFLRDLLVEFEAVELMVSPNAETGIEMVRMLRPHLVLMDLNLPGMNGVEAAMRLREWPQTREIPIVALTAAATQRSSDWVRDAGFAKFLSKPVRVEALMQALEELLPP